MNHSLKYLDSQKGRLTYFIGAAQHSFFNPVCFKEQRIYGVQITAEKEIKVFDGLEWEVTTDEDLIYKILVRLEKIFKAQNSRPKAGELPLKEAVLDLQYHFEKLIFYGKDLRSRN